MADDLRATLEHEFLSTGWALLAVHQERDALLIVREPVELLEAAVAIAEDDRTKVARWLEAGALARPTPAQVEAWAREEDLHFDAVIVQPFVLARPRRTHPGDHARKHESR